MFSEFAYPFGEDGDLNFGRACIVVVSSELGDYGLFFVFLDQSNNLLY